MASSPLRSFFYLALLGVALLTIALVVRSGILARKNPGKPINSAMREALDNNGVPQLNTEDARIIAEKFGTAHKLPSGLLYVERAPGTGTATPQVGNQVTAHYDGRLLDGTPFDSSYKRGEPITFTVGVGQVVKGWDEAFLSMKKGEKRTIIIPYWLGYGVTGRGPTIPPRATLVFDVELVSFR
jgi:FKBP-type peptidyl-prolyl cis-trans isomerase